MMIFNVQPSHHLTSRATTALPPSQGALAVVQGNSETRCGKKHQQLSETVSRHATSPSAATRPGFRQHRRCADLACRCPHSDALPRLFTIISRWRRLTALWAVDDCHADRRRSPYMHYSPASSADARIARICACRRRWRCELLLQQPVVVSQQPPRCPVVTLIFKWVTVVRLFIIII